jgi:DMSO/TMAO reductase YedYZ molybdopterin-dependent catalytic subunit
MRRVLVLLIAIFGIVTITFTGVIYSQHSPTDLNSLDVHDYEGQQLSSIHDFRENSILGPQNISEDKYRLTITGLVQKPQTYAYNEILTNFPAYEKVVTLHCVEGWSVTILWEGVRIMDLLAPTEINSSVTTVIFYAADGYSTSLPLEYLEKNNILMAYKINGVTLPKELGFPFQLGAESKWGYKWIKWIATIDLSDNASYEGFWESRGFPNDADI